MNRKKIVILLWIVINAILVTNYFWDANSIQCEPCLPGTACPPCQTDFMADFWWYFSIWNLIILLTGLRIRKDANSK